MKLQLPHGFKISYFISKSNFSCLKNKNILYIRIYKKIYPGPGMFEVALFPVFVLDFCYLKYHLKYFFASVEQTYAMSAAGHSELE